MQRPLVYSAKHLYALLLEMDRFNHDLSRVLKHLRLQNEMSQAEAAQYLHLGRRTISKIETCERGISVEELLHLFSGYNVPIIYGLACTMIAFQSSGHDLSITDSRLLQGIILELTHAGYAVPAIASREKP